MERKYRLGYDRVFLAHPSIKIENEVIAGLSIFIKYKLFDINSDLEIAFTEEEQAIGIGAKYISEDEKYLELDDFYMNDFIKCYFDKAYQGYIKLEEINKEKLEQWGYRLEYEISSYNKDVYTDETYIRADPKKISKEEFEEILSENLNNFDNDDNKIEAQSCGYETYPIEENEENMKLYVVNIITSNQESLYLMEEDYTTDIEKAKKHRSEKLAENTLMRFYFKNSKLGNGGLQAKIIEV